MFLKKIYQKKFNLTFSSKNGGILFTVVKESYFAIKNRVKNSKIDMKNIIF